MPEDILTVTTRTVPSYLGCTCRTLARGHLVVATLSPCSITMSPTDKFREGRYHLANLLRVVRCSVDHLCQKCWTRFWHKCQRWRRGINDKRENDLEGNPEIYQWENDPESIFKNHPNHKSREQVVCCWGRLQFESIQWTFPQVSVWLWIQCILNDIWHSSLQLPRGPQNEVYIQG